MLKKQAQVFLTLLMLADLTLIWGCWILAYFLRFRWINFPQADSLPEFSFYLQASSLVVIFATFSFVKGKMYHPRRLSRFQEEAGAILRSNGILLLILLGAMFFYRNFSFSRIHVVYFLILSSVELFIFRLLVRLTLGYLRKRGKNLRHILVIGKGETARLFFDRIKTNSALGFNLVGFVDSGGDAHTSVEEKSIGDYHDLPEIIADNGIDQVYIALDSNQQSDLQQINDILAEQIVDLYIVPDIVHTLNISPEVLDIDGLPIIALRQSPITGWGKVSKRLLDLVGSTVGILLLTPLWIVLSILIKLTSAGPIFYRQERMGLDGTKFDMIKFRSMKVDAETVSGAVWARKDDNRTTPLGALLRKSSLDELPQLFNVFVGDMSLVGPRPERPVFIDQFKRKIPNYMLRHKVKAGMTGWAQVNGWRGNTSLEKRIECDIYYLTNWSIYLDLKILFLQIFNFSHPNAY
jgi:Undecaprenyl-phosphate glucose phosphotransferase